MGCGHGRDANYFREQGNIVYAYDISPSAIAKAQELFRAKGIKFYCRDLLGKRDDGAMLGVRQCNLVYARWFLHTLAPGVGEEAFIKMFMFSKKGGLICLEYKTEKTDTASIYNTEHMRIPVNPKGLLQYAINMGIEVVYHREGYGMSVMGDHDPYLARTILRKV